MLFNTFHMLHFIFSSPEEKLTCKGRAMGIEGNLLAAIRNLSDNLETHFYCRLNDEVALSLFHLRGLPHVTGRLIF